MNLNNEGHSHGAASSPEEVIKAALRTEHGLIKIRTGRLSFQKTVCVSFPALPDEVSICCCVTMCRCEWGAGEREKQGQCFLVQNEVSVLQTGFFCPGAAGVTFQNTKEHVASMNRAFVWASHWLEVKDCFSPHATKRVPLFLARACKRLFMPEL